MLACAAFDNVHGDRKRGAPRLRTEFILFVRGKRFQRELMDFNEEIVGALLQFNQEAEVEVLRTVEENVTFIPPRDLIALADSFERMAEFTEKWESTERQP